LLAASRFPPESEQSIMDRCTSDLPRIARRSFLQIGAAGLAGLSLAKLLRAESNAGIRSSQKSVIFVHLDGGPPHQDMIDLKPDAPEEIRGEFKPIATTLPGLQVCELLPRLARSAERYVFIRSLTQSAGAHDAFQCQSGFPAADLQTVGGRPALGSVLTKLVGKSTDAAPTFVDLMQGRPYARNSARSGFLGPSYQPFRADISHLFTRELQPGMLDEIARRGGVQTATYEINQALNASRIDDRTQLLARLDRVRRDIDSAGMMSAMDGFSQQAVNILTSGRLAQALDFSQDDPRTLARYSLEQTAPRTIGSGDGTDTNDSYDAIRKFLLARKLVEAGVRVVSLSISDFDTHRINFDRLRYLLPIVDTGLHALTTDLEERGLTDDVSIVVWGEFGRTPKINASGGRDHWPAAGMCLLAGGGMRTGQIIGATDRYAGAVTSRPVRYPDVFATLYRNLGFDPVHTHLIDPSGRPQTLTHGGTVLAETA
jgi:hypothetical protein